MRPVHLLSTLFPPLLLLLSFIFSLIATTSNNWSSSAVYTGDTLSSRTLQANDTRGPYKSTFYAPDLVSLNFTATNSAGICVDGDEPFFCQQLSVGAHLLVAGCVFTGLAGLGVVGLFLMWGVFGGVGRGCEEREKRHHHHGHHHERSEAVAEPSASTKTTGKYRHIGFSLLHWSRTFTMLMMVVAVMCMFFGTIITAEVLLNEQRPDGDFISSGPDTVMQDHWMLEKGVTFGFLGGFFTLVGIVLVPSVYPLGGGHRRWEKEAVD
ncbi:MAG: hypothetical protein MMC33_005354 [Icmadophila ericetorum]|nr:hypothetical protein [Icmadophila ericetorum]